MTFLAGREARNLAGAAPGQIIPIGLYLGQGAMGVEVAVYESKRKPDAPEIRELHKERLGRRAAPAGPVR